MQAPDDHRETRQGANHARCDEAMARNGMRLGRLRVVTPGGSEL